MCYQQVPVTQECWTSRDEIMVNGRQKQAVNAVPENLDSKPGE